MDYQITQRNRSLLQTRVRRVKGCKVGQYGEQLKFLLNFIDSNLVFSAAKNQLLQGSSISKEEFDKILSQNNGYDFENETDYVSCAYYALEKIATSNSKSYQNTLVFGATLASGGKHFGIANDEVLETINDFFLEPFYDYLDESVDNRNAILLLLQKYKQRCEWFQKSGLESIAVEGSIYGKKGERGLMYDMYEYLHHQGLDINIEPKSASGEVDLVADQKDEDRLILDGKYVKEGEVDSAIKSKIISGFRQVYDYCCDFNSRVGYLVIYNSSGKAIGVDSMKSDGFDYCEINGKLIYFINIDIHRYEKTASKRGQLQVISISRDEVIKSIEE